MKRQGKYARGEQHPAAQWSDADVQQAVELVERYGLSQRQVARKFCVSRSTLQRWLSGETRLAGTRPGDSAIER